MNQLTILRNLHEIMVITKRCQNECYDRLPVVVANPTIMTSGLFIDKLRDEMQTIKNLVDDITGEFPA